MTKLQYRKRWSKTTASMKSFMLAVAVVCASLCPSALAAQLIRGVARTADNERPIARARIMALRLDGRSVGEAMTDDEGRFELRVSSGNEPFAISVTRIGMKPTLSGTLYLGSRDTLDVDFSVAEEAIRTDTVRVRAAPLLNEIRLKEAERRGWRVFPPKEIAVIRDRVMSFEDLLRSTGYTGLMLSPRRDDCIRSTRNYKCLLIVVDGVPLSGSYPNINPRDVYFLALLTPNQAMLQFGDRGPNGALLVYTRAYGDKIDK